MTNSRKVFRVFGVAIVVLLVLFLDFACRNIYRSFRPATHGRTSHPVYDHGYRANFQWIDKYGPLRTPFFSNSLGFRDSKIREVSLKS